MPVRRLATDQLAGIVLAGLAIVVTESVGAGCHTTK